VLHERLIDELRRTIDQGTLDGQPIELRPYQMDASVQSALHLLQGEGVVIDLPTGTGKTMIANMVTYLWRKARPDSRVLYVVPRRVLVGQHHQHSKWLSPDSFTLAIDQDIMRNPGKYYSRLATYHVYVTTPRLFANSVRDLRTDPRIFSKIDLVIVDEFDESLFVDYQQYGTVGRFKRDLESLYQLFDSNVSVMLMSATSPLKALQRGSRDPAVRAFCDFIVSQIDPLHVVKLDESQYANHVPTARVRLVSVLDKDVSEMGLALKTETAFAFRDYTCETGVELDADFLYPRLEKTAYGKIQYVREADQTWVVADEEVKTLCRKLRAILNKTNFLFEDLFQGFDWEIDKRRLVCEHELDTIDDETPKFGDVRVLLDSRPDDRYRALLRGKFDSLQQIVTCRPEDSGVVFTRYIRLSDAICDKLNEMGISYTQIDSRVKGRQLHSRLQDFREGRTRILVITRDTGKRGLDLPKADYAVFYSPKASERTVWQELSRIRSTIHSTKDSYFLVYEESGEEEKAHDLASQMRISGREYQIISHRDADLLDHLEELSTPA
jgi:superfamily II DNA or RNA helicase